MPALGKIAHKLMRFFGIPVLGLTQEPVLPCDICLHLLPACQRFEREGGDNGGKAHSVSRRTLRGAYEDRRYPVLRNVGEVCVEQGRKLVYHALIDRYGQMHQLVLNSIVAQHHDDYECVRVDVDKVKALYRRRRVGRDGKRGIIRQLRSDLSDVAHHTVKLDHLVVEAAVYLLRLLNGKLLLFHELVDIQPVARGSGDTSGRCVRLLEIAHRGQLRELAADGGRAAA